MITLEKIIEELNNRGYNAESHNVVKNNITYRAIMIKNGEQVIPVIYVDKIIEEAEFNNWKLERVIEEILATYTYEYEYGQLFKPELKQFLNKDFILNNVYVGMQMISNEDIIKCRIKEFPDLEAYIYVRNSVEDDVYYTSKLPDKTLDIYNINESELWKKAYNNTFNENIIESIFSLMKDEYYTEFDEDVQRYCPLYVVSNSSRIRGAAAILNKPLLKKFGEEHSCKKVIAIPSSIHEFIILPYDPLISLDEITDMIKQVNVECVEPEIQLSDRAYILSV